MFGKPRLLLLLCLLMTSSLFAQQRNCGSMDYLQSQIEANPERAYNLQQIEKQTARWIAKNQGEFKDGELLTIPVVVHVIYNNSNENISDAQVLSQITVLNDDFRRLNSDQDNEWGQAADTEIEFCMATIDPDGNPTDGITRTSTNQSSFGTNDQMKFNSSGGKDAWPAGDYLNIWVCDISGGILGYAQFPGGPASTDGVVIDYQYYGTIGTATSPFDLGRTGTHEVGHWLNLRHIWGDGGCSVDDFVGDTPTSDAPNYGCALGHTSCGSTDMVQNYMDYSDDACMNLFTAGQRDRMQALFGSGGSRESLMTSEGCGGSPPPPPPSCEDNEVVVTINLDNYPEETSWQITDSGGSVVASGGTYGNQADGSTVTIDLCLVDGCYDFTISDSYGDGICCGYGNGSYSVDNNGTNLASGGSFGSSETTNFCLGGGSTPTCNDGILNGNETGVDCGGPDCDACPTCDDGILNGNETDVDCGGPDCDACPTCNDGIQNGNETGVDCGGPDCDACDTGGTTTLSAHYFESGWDGWQDGGSDCYRYSGSRSWEGSYSIRIRDNSGTASAMTSPTYNLSNYSQVDVEFYFYPNSMENGEDFWLRYYDGSSWQTVASYASGSSFNNNNFYVATVTLNNGSYNFPSNAQFRFQCDASGNADRIYIDAVTITASGNGSRVNGESLATIEPLSRGEADNDFDFDIRVSPNPAQQYFSVQGEFDQLSILSLDGKLVRNIKNAVENDMIDISDLENGLYIIQAETDGEMVYEKLMKH